MVAVILGLLGAVVFGAGDFIGGLAAKRISALKVTFVSATTGLGIITLGSLLLPGKWSFEALWWGGMAGVFGSIAIMMIYASLAIGPMSILAPLGAFVSAAFPVTWAMFFGERLGNFGLLGLGLGLVAVVLVGFVPEKSAVRPSAKGLLLAVGAGFLIGGFLICINNAPSDAGLVPLISNRIVSAAIMGSAIAAVALAGRIRASRAQTNSDAPKDESTDRVSGWRAGLKLAILCGLVDGTGNALLLLGIQIGDLSVMSVLTAMYPAGTILLAAIVLKERVAPIQAAGLVLAIAAAALLSLA